MRRVATILVVFVATLGLIMWLVVARAGETAVRTGTALYSHRVVLQLLEHAAHEPRPALVWLGDSSLMDTPNIPSYPTLVDHEDLEPRGLHGLLVAAMGFDFYAYYSLLGDVLDLGPRAVVMIANFRVSIPEGGVRGFNDLTGELRLGQLPDMLALPYSFRGMTAPRLLLARALETGWGEASFLFAEGMRRAFQERPFWQLLGPVEPRALSPWEIFVKGRDGVLADYRHPVRLHHPLMRFAGAAVARAVARGVHVLVVVTPVPVERLTAIGWYDAEEYARRVTVLRAIVEPRGGRVLDLQDALPDRLLRDAGGHFTAAGSARMAELVWPTVAELVGVSPP